MKEFVSLCLKKVPAEASVYVLPILTIIYFSLLLCMLDQCLCMGVGENNNKYWNSYMLSLYPKLICSGICIYLFGFVLLKFVSVNLVQCIDEFSLVGSLLY